MNVSPTSVTNSIATRGLHITWCPSPCSGMEEQKPKWGIPGPIAIHPPGFKVQQWVGGALAPTTETATGQVAWQESSHLPEWLMKFWILSQLHLFQSWD